MFNKITKAAVTDTDCWRQGLGNQGNQIKSIPQLKKIRGSDTQWMKWEVLGFWLYFKYRIKGIC